MDMRIIMSVVVGLIIYLIYRLITKIIKFKKISNALHNFPMDPIHWFWGHLKLCTGSYESLEFSRERTCRHPKLCTSWSLFRGSLILYNPENVKTLLKTTEPKQITTGSYKYNLSWLGDGLILSYGEKWTRNRKLLNNAFSLEALKYYFQVKNCCTEIFLSNLQTCTENGKSVDIFNRVTHLALDIILKCIFSYETDVQNQQNHPYIKAVNALQELWAKRCLNPWHHYDFIYSFSKDSREYKKNASYVHKISESLIAERKKARLLSTINKGRDFLDITLDAKDENGVGLTDVEIRNEVDTFLLAGHDPSASGIAWTLYLLAVNTEEQKRCQKEIDDIFEGRPNNNIEWDDLQKLKYLTLCIKEALRIHSPIPFIGRELHNPVTIEGVEMPVGSAVSVHIHALHHNPSIWPDSTKFCPIRFSPENIKSMDTFSYIPFSSGPRNCIGQTFAMNEIKLVVATTLRRFSLAMDSEHPTTPRLIITLKCEDGMMMKITERFP